MAIGESDWRVVSREYRKLLYGMGSEGAVDTQGRPKRQLSEKALQEVNERGGELSLPTLLRCRVRYFTDGLVYGSERFVEGIYEQKRVLFGRKRKRGAKRMRGGDWGELRVMRDLRKEVIGES